MLMKSRLCVVLVVVLLFAACSAGPKTWVAYYGADAPPEMMQDFDVVVVDPGYRGSISLLKARGAKVLAYLSIGEIATHHKAFLKAKQAGLLVRENVNWKGAWVVDVRNPAWQQMVVQELAPALLRRGFDGLFLDTIDSPIHLGHTEAKRFPGMKQAAVRLVQALHAGHPQAALMLNGGLPIIGDVRDAVHMMAIESTKSTWDFKKKRPLWRSSTERRAGLARLAKARADNPDLKVFTLDYWDPADRKSVQRIYAAQRKHGFIPYVATIALTRVVAELKLLNSVAPTLTR